MTQALHPNADISNLSWSPTIIWDQIAQQAEEVVTTNVFLSPTGGSFEVELEDGVDPLRDDGHTLIIELKGEYENEEEIPEDAHFTMDVALTQGSTIIVTESFVDPPEEYEFHAIALSEEQAALITNYANLQLSVSANLIAELGGGPGGGPGGPPG